MRIVVVALALSLAVNVFLGGFIAGRLVNTERPGGHHGRPLDVLRPAPFHSAMESISPEGREVVRGIFEARRQAMREGHRERLGLRRSFAEALSAEPFDRARAEAALAAMEDADSKSLNAVGRLMIESAEKLSAADRKVLAAAYTGPRKRLLRGPRGEPLDPRERPPPFGYFEEPAGPPVGEEAPLPPAPPEP